MRTASMLAESEQIGKPPAVLVVPEQLSEVLVWLDLEEHSIIGAVSRQVASSAREINWQRLTASLIDGCGFLTPRLVSGHFAAPRGPQMWRSCFLDLWKHRLKWCRSSATTTGLSVRSVVRFLPDDTSDESHVHQPVFLPLHQFLQLIKHEQACRSVSDRFDGVDPGTDAEVSHEHLEQSRLDLRRMRARVLSTNDARVLVALSGVGLRYFDFDLVLDKQCGQERVYQSCALPAVEACLQGTPACVLCYGQSKLGNKLAMFGWKDECIGAAHTEGLLAPEEGLVPKALTDVFLSSTSCPNVSTTVSLSLIEVCEDHVVDLISGQEVRSSSKPVDVLDAHSVCISDAAEGLHALARSLRMRSSSASKGAYVIVSLGLTQRLLATGEVLRSRLCFVDLAERESSSLTALSRVMDALARKGRGSVSVPYRESKLTMVLQPVLSAPTAFATVLVMASSDDSQGDETAQALRFGERCSRHPPSPTSRVSMSEVLASHPEISSAFGPIDATKEYRLGSAIGTSSVTIRMTHTVRACAQAP